MSNVRPPGEKFPRLRAGTFIEALTGGRATRRVRDFPAFGRGLSLRPLLQALPRLRWCHFPAFGRGLSLRQPVIRLDMVQVGDFPAFGRGLSLRPTQSAHEAHSMKFPRLRAGTFIEARMRSSINRKRTHFPAFGRGLSLRPTLSLFITGAWTDFPAFGRGLSLRPHHPPKHPHRHLISPPSGGDFH